MNQIANKIMPSDLVAEYNEKVDMMPEIYEKFAQSRDELVAACSVMGSYGGTIWGNYHVPDPQIEILHLVLRKSAWKRVYENWIKDVATAKDKQKIETMLEKPPEFSIETLREEFGEYIIDPWGTVLRGLAEVFCQLDPYYKSHTKVGIGKKGLPKRIIISGFSSWSDSYGKEKVTDIVNALRAYRREPLTTYAEVSAWVKAARQEPTELRSLTNKYEDHHSRLDDLKLKIFANGNGHIFFGRNALIDINKALKEYYGEVLPDVDVEVTEKSACTQVSKDLQYYPTPKKIVEKLFYDIHVQKHHKVLEPSCGDGRILDELKDRSDHVVGVEVDFGRVRQARLKGHSVVHANFLEMIPTNDYDFVIMNPPFYGKHYQKHIEHALKFLNSDGKLVAVLPASAKYDHDFVNKEWLEKNNAIFNSYGSWRDFPVGSFSESGTNINTVQLMLFKQ